MSFIRVDSFRENVQRASRMLFGPAVADRPRLTAEQIEQQLREIEQQPQKYAPWLTPQTVSDFDQQSFQFLAPEELDQLTRAVGEVRDAAKAIPDGSRAHPQQLDRARPPFVQVVELMGYDRYDDADAYIRGKTIERQLVPVQPPHLDHLRFRTGFDSTDDPALWVWAFVAETGEYDEASFLAHANVIEDVLEPIAREVAPERRVYLRFRSTLDLPEAQGVPA